MVNLHGRSQVCVPDTRSECLKFVECPRYIGQAPPRSDRNLPRLCSPPGYCIDYDHGLVLVPLPEIELDQRSAVARGARCPANGLRFVDVSQRNVVGRCRKPGRGYREVGPNCYLALTTSRNRTVNEHMPEHDVDGVPIERPLVRTEEIAHALVKVGVSGGNVVEQLCCRREVAGRKERQARDPRGVPTIACRDDDRASLVLRAHPAYQR